MTTNKDPREYLYNHEPGEHQRVPRIGNPYPVRPWECTRFPDGRVVPEGGRPRTLITVQYGDALKVAVSVLAAGEHAGKDSDRYYVARRDELIALDEATGVRPRRGVSAEWLLDQARQCKIEAGKNWARLFREWASRHPEVLEVLKQKMPSGGSRPEKLTDAQIIALAVQHPDMTKVELARVAGRHESALSRGKLGKALDRARTVGKIGAVARLRDAEEDRQR